MKLPKRASLNTKIPENIETSSLESYDLQSSKTPIVEKNILISSIDNFFKNDVMYKNIPAEAEEYWSSDYKRKKYEDLKTKDTVFEHHILKKYGSYANYERETGMDVAESIFNPKTDFKIDVTIITKSKYYKTDHISSQELIREALYGVCTVDYQKTNGAVSRLVGTLYKKYILPSQIEERLNFFSPLPRNRIVLWNMIKQDWSSFYMPRVIRFVRDDTTDLE